MQVLHGIGVSPGVAIGEALVVDNEGFRIPRRFVVRDAVEDELQRLDEAIRSVGEQISENRSAISKRLGDQYAAIFSAHLQLLQDPKLHDELESLIRERHFSPEYAVSRTFRDYAKVFREMDNPYLAERAHDLFDLEKNLLGNLLGRRREELSHLVSPVIVLAHNLTPSETANLDRDFALGFITEIGGAGGHTAIVAKGLEIPAVVGTGLFLTDVSGGDMVIVDGDHGRVILQPDEETLQRYQQEVQDHISHVERLEEIRDLPAETRDGVKIQLLANIEFPHEAESCLTRGAEGIGLYRTEFLYLGTDNEPTEEDHFNAYASVVRALGDGPVVIRTLDLGADKLGLLPRHEEETNPFLGLRSIRLSLRNRDGFRVQLRAVLRASALGNVHVMFPLISTLSELRQAKMVLADAMEDLSEQNIPFDPEIKVGMMVEVPSAVMMLDKFLEEVDFVSIGTNDLVQYALAVDRSNKDVADLYSDADPAVLRLIRLSLDESQRANTPVSVCGQMSGNPLFSALLIGMGLRRFSVPPSSVPEVKKICRSVTIPECEAIAKRALSMDTAQRIERYLAEELRKFAPDLSML